MAQGSFAAQMSDWTRETKERMRAVHKGSAQAIVRVMQTPRGEGGNLRVDTGFLRASLVATTGAAMPPQTMKPDGVKAFRYNPGPINLIIANADIKDPITVVYTANYARPREYGARGQAADRWVALAAQRWPQVVAEECAKAQASVASRSGA